MGMWSYNLNDEKTDGKMKCNLKKSSTHRSGVVSCCFRSSPGARFYAVGNEAFHTSEEA